jgi:hypothetical protein
VTPSRSQTILCAVRRPCHAYLCSMRSLPI